MKAQFPRFNPALGRVRDPLDLVELSEFENRYPAELSCGMQHAWALRGPWPMTQRYMEWLKDAEVLTEDIDANELVNNSLIEAINADLDLEAIAAAE